MNRFRRFPSDRIGAKLTESLAQIAIVRDTGPFSNLAPDPFRGFLHFCRLV
jgi:hypothetical protein